MVVIEEEKVVSSDGGEDEKKHSEDDVPPSSNTEGKGKQSRNEKKARQAIMRHGVKHMPNITNVVIKKDRRTCFSIANADVYKSLTSETYIFFGEAKIEDSSTQRQSEAAKRFTKEEAPKDVPEAPIERKGSFQLKDDDPNVVLVMDQTNCSKESAISALKRNKGDFIEAIMELTTNME